MGGQALKIAKTRRYSKEEYNNICEEVTKILGHCNITVAIPKSFREKDSFGDLDILILDDENLKKHLIRDIIVDIFKPTEIYHNNHINSFDYKEFQIDFITVQPENWQTSIIYFSYNDLGNLMGRISYNMGLRYGDYGLKLVYRHDDGGRKFERIISKSPNKIFEFLGFDWNSYERGFNSLDDVFNFVVTSKYFNVEIFQYEKLDHQNRTRNKKRKNYAAFLEYIKPLNNTYTYLNKDEYVYKIEEFFHLDLRSQIEKWKKIVDEQKRASGKFNGNVVMEHYPLRGKELGDAMMNFKNYFNNILDINQEQKDIHYNRWILDNSEIQILDVFARVNGLKSPFDIYGADTPIDKQSYDQEKRFFDPK